MEKVTCEVNEVLSSQTGQHDAKRHKRSVSDFKDLNSSEDHPVIAETPETIYLSPQMPESLTQTPDIRENISDDMSLVKLNLSVPSVDEEDVDKEQVPEKGDSQARKLVPSKWKLNPTDFLLEAGISMKMLELSYSEVNTTIEGKINITCTSNHSSPLTASSFISYILIPTDSLNLTVEDSLMERYFPYPEYIDLAPCPCDLTEDGCDVACCCDTDCDQEVTEAHNCSKQKRRPESRILEEYKCSKNSSIFLCIEFANSPFIDVFFPVRSIVRTFPEFSQHIASHLSRLNILVPAPTSYQNYIKGKPMKIHLGNRERYWLLPSNSVSQECDTKSVVNFGDEFYTRCLSRMNKHNCIGNANFVIDSFVNIVETETGPVFSDLIPEELHGIKMARTNVTINRIQDVSSYLSETTHHDVHNTHINLEDITQDCLSSSACRPSLSKENVCKNVVVEVHYLVEWEGPTVSLVHVEIILGDVVLEQRTVNKREHKRVRKALSDSTEMNHIKTEHVTQVFSVSFQHVPFTVNDVQDACRESRNTTIMVPSWSQDSDGFCDTSVVTFVEMKKDESTTSTCWLPVSPKNVTSCATYRRYLCDVQQKLFQLPNWKVDGALITKNSSLCEDAQINSTSCDNHPTHVNIEILYAEQALQSVPSQVQILGINISYVAVPCLPCVGILKEDCENFMTFENGDDIISPVPSCLPTNKVVLTLTINAIEASVNARTNTKKFWYRDYPWECPFFVCWNELFYPFSELNDTDELLSYPILALIIGIAVGSLAFVAGFSPY